MKSLILSLLILISAGAALASPSDVVQCRRADNKEAAPFLEIKNTIIFSGGIGKAVVLNDGSNEGWGGIGFYNVDVSQKGNQIEIKGAVSTLLEDLSDFGTQEIQVKFDLEDARLSRWLEDNSIELEESLSYSCKTYKY